LRGNTFVCVNEIYLQFNQNYSSMKKITEIKEVLAAKCLLTPCQMLQTKGGADICEDDKRRPRPGGGASTQ
jgi:hypothetical protein